MLTHHETGSGLENEIRCSVGHKGLGIPYRDIPACANNNEGGDLGQPAGKAELLQSLHLELGTYPVASIHRAAEKMNSRKFASRILHIPGPIGPELPRSALPYRTGPMLLATRLDG